MKKPFWYLIEELPEYPAQSLRILVETDRLYKEYGLVNSGPFFQHYKNGAGPLYAASRSWDRLRNELLSTLKENPEWYRENQKRIRHWARALEKLCPEVEKMNLKKLTNRRLGALYRKLENAITLMHLQRGPGWFMEQHDESFSKFLLEELRAQAEKAAPEIDAVGALATLLTSPRRTKTFEEQVVLLKLASRSGQAPKRALKTHLRKYWHLTYGVTGPGMTFREVEERFSKMRLGDPKAELLRIKEQQRALAREQRRLLKTLRLSKKLAALLRIGQLIGYEKAWSKELQFYAFAMRDKISREAGRRLGLSLRQVLWMTWEEIFQAISAKRFPDANELNQRWKESGLLMDRKGMRFTFGRELIKFLRENKLEAPPKASPNLREIQGSSAVAGEARGRVRIVNTPGEMHKMKDGNILVSVMTIPEIVPAMKKAAAIVTDVGGITCHAAIVSRELNIPCVIGTKIATQVLQDGDLVEVDANQGIVRKL